MQADLQCPRKLKKSEDTSCVYVSYGSSSAVIQKDKKFWTGIGYVSHEGWSAVSQQAQEFLTDISCVCVCVCASPAVK